MTKFRLLTAIAAMIAITSSHAQSPDEWTNSELYLRSVALPKKARVCAVTVPGYGERFQTSFDSWKSRNRDRLAAGETLLRAEATKANKSFALEVEMVTTLDAESLRRAPQALIIENCDAMLEQMGAGAK
jgi:hypothetical protein